MVERFRRGLSFEERDRDIVVADRDSISEFEFLAQTECALKPERAFLWVAHGQTKMSDHAELERDFHFHISNKRAACEKRTHPKMIALALILRSEEHTSELQSPCNLVCRLLLEKKK